MGRKPHLAAMSDEQVDEYAGLLWSEVAAVMTEQRLRRDDAGRQAQADVGEHGEQEGQLQADDAPHQLVIPSA